MGTTFAAVVWIVWIAAFLPYLAGAVLLTYLLYAGFATRSLHQESRQVEQALPGATWPKPGPGWP